MVEEEKVVAGEKEEGAEKNTVMALLCYLGILIIVPLVTEAKKEAYVKFHIKQGIILLIGWVVMWPVSIILGFIPILGWVLIFLLWIFLIVLNIIGIVNSLTKKESELPIVGKYAAKIKI